VHQEYFPSGFAERNPIVNLLYQETPSAFTRISPLGHGTCQFVRGEWFAFW